MLLRGIEGVAVDRDGEGQWDAEDESALCEKKKLLIPFLGIGGKLDPDWSGMIFLLALWLCVGAVFVEFRLGWRRGGGGVK